MFIKPRDGDRIVRELKTAIGYDVNIMDRTGTIVASTDPARVGQLHPIAQRIMQEQLPALEVPAAEADNVLAGINLPIEVDGRWEGVIGITGPVDTVRVYGTIAKKMTEILLNSLRQQEQQSLLERTRNLFIEEWIFSAEPDWTSLALRGQLIGIDTALPRRVALLASSGGLNDPSAEELRRRHFLQVVEARLRREPDCVWAMINQRLLILFSGSSIYRAARLLDELCQETKSRWSIGFTGGLSSVSRNAADLRRCYSEAKIAAHVGAQDHSVREYNGVSLEFILHNLDQKVKQDVLQSVFPPDSGADHAELLETLHLYFLCDGNIESAAAKACVHENTFRYRLQKLSRITGYDIRKPKDAVMLYIALVFSDFGN